MTEAVYDPIGKAREQRRVLDLIPEPDAAFHAAAKSAMIQAGLSDEIVDLLDRNATAPTPK